MADIKLVTNKPYHHSVERSGGETKSAESATKQFAQPKTSDHFSTSTCCNIAQGLSQKSKLENDMIVILDSRDSSTKSEAWWDSALHESLPQLPVALKDINNMGIDREALHDTLRDIAKDKSYLSINLSHGFD